MIRKRVNLMNVCSHFFSTVTVSPVVSFRSFFQGQSVVLGALYPTEWSSSCHNASESRRAIAWIFISDEANNAICSFFVSCHIFWSKEVILYSSHSLFEEDTQGVRYDVGTCLMNYDRVPSYTTKMLLVYRRKRQKYDEIRWSYHWRTSIVFLSFPTVYEQYFRRIRWHTVVIHEAWHHVVLLVLGT
jgi:hypothetical protein